MEGIGFGDEEFKEFRNKEVEWVVYVKEVFEERKIEIVGV